MNNKENPSNSKDLLAGMSCVLGAVNKASKNNCPCGVFILVCMWEDKE
jgi:hypothetical protein